VRTVTEFVISSYWDARASALIIEFRISSHGFLRYMVRSIVGTMLEVGRGEKDSDTILAAIEGGERSLAGRTAPASGLTLLKVEYE
jgi:tRNA pseudouridine38-40 synthase